MIYKLFTDGGARGNPGPAGIGAILFARNEKLIWFESKYIGKSTNNQAEYKAILMGIECFVDNETIDTDTKLICYLDSELIVKQMNGQYKIKDAKLKRIHEQIQDLIHELDIEFVHIYREKNKFADKLVNISLDARDE